MPRPFSVIVTQRAGHLLWTFHPTYPTCTHNSHSCFAPLHYAPRRSLHATRYRVGPLTHARRAGQLDSTTPRLRNHLRRLSFLPVTYIFRRETTVTLHTLLIPSERRRDREDVHCLACHVRLAEEAHAFQLQGAQASRQFLINTLYAWPAARKRYGLTIRQTSISSDGRFLDRSSCMAVVAYHTSTLSFSPAVRRHRAA
jgi:hypothetical protein